MSPFSSTFIPCSSLGSSALAVSFFLAPNFLVVNLGVVAGSKVKSSVFTSSSSTCGSGIEVVFLVVNFLPKPPPNFLLPAAGIVLAGVVGSI